MRAVWAVLLVAFAVAAATAAIVSTAEPPAEQDAEREGGAPAASDAGAPVRHVSVASFDGTTIRATVFRPPGASVEAPVPIVLHSHGWSGNRTTEASGIVGRLVDAGFGVVSVDARGHGESGGMATVHHERVEVRDWQVLVDWIHDNLAWVQKDPNTGIAKDVVLGGAGYSYGGGIQLMLASHDKRVDAIAPEITWSHLPEALAPQGVVKSVWVDVLIGSAKQSGTRVDPRIEEWYQDAMSTNAFPHEAYAHFLGSSPRLHEIDADVLLVQGVPDVLFNLNQAIRTYDALQARGAGDVRLFTHLSGHVLPYAQPLGASADRRLPFADAGPCGSAEEAVVAWLDEHLRAGPPSGLAEVSLALDAGGECVTLDALPSATRAFSAEAAWAPVAAGTTLVPLGEGPLVVAGAPRLTARVAAGALGGHTFASLVVVGANGGARVLDDQTQPVRLPPGGEVDVELVAVAARVHEGERLMLRLDGANEWFATNGDRSPGLVLMSDLVVTLPVIDA